MMRRRIAIVAGMLMLLSTVIGGASCLISEDYQRAYDEMVLTDGGTVLLIPKTKPAVPPRVAEDPLWNILPPLR